MKCWTGNSNSIYKMLGASNHTDEDRAQNDYYATEPKAMQLLLSVEKFNQNIWECACGEGHLSKVLIENGYDVKSTDLIDRGFGTGGVNFIGIDNIAIWAGDIITNPPYRFAQNFIEKALQIIPKGGKIAMFLKLQFLEGQKRKSLFKLYPPKVVYVASRRLTCAKNGNFEEMTKRGGSAVAYAWYVWEKGYQGDPIIKWIN